MKPLLGPADTVTQHSPAFSHGGHGPVTDGPEKEPTNCSTMHRRTAFNLLNCHHRISAEVEVNTHGKIAKKDHRQSCRLHTLPLTLTFLMTSIRKPRSGSTSLPNERACKLSSHEHPTPDTKTPIIHDARCRFGVDKGALYGEQRSRGTRHVYLLAVTDSWCLGLRLRQSAKRLQSAV